PAAPDRRGRLGPGPGQLGRRVVLRPAVGHDGRRAALDARPPPGPGPLARGCGPGLRAARVRLGVPGPPPCRVAVLLAGGPPELARAPGAGRAGGQRRPGVRGDRAPPPARPRARDLMPRASPDPREFPGPAAPAGLSGGRHRARPVLADPVLADPVLADPVPAAPPRPVPAHRRARPVAHRARADGPGGGRAAR